MVKHAYNESGRLVHASDAIRMRDAGELHRYACDCTTYPQRHPVRPRKGVHKGAGTHDSILVHFPDHFYHAPHLSHHHRSQLRTGRETIDAIITRSCDQGTMLKKAVGKLQFKYVQQPYGGLATLDLAPDFLSTAMYYDIKGTSYLVLLLSSVPQSTQYEHTLRFCYDTDIQKHLLSPNGEQRLPDRLYVATVMLKNNNFWKLVENNPSSGQGMLHLGKWEDQILLRLHPEGASPEFNFLNVEHSRVEVATMDPEKHGRFTSYARHPLFTLAPVDIPKCHYPFSETHQHPLGVARIVGKTSVQMDFNLGL